MVNKNNLKISEKELENENMKKKVDKKNPHRKTGTALEDITVNIKVKLALFWVALMFFYIYNDLFSLFQPGTIEELIDGEIAGIQFTQAVLFGAAVLMALPSFMIFLSLTLKAKTNRQVNLTVGIFHMVILVSTLLVPGDIWAYYALYMIFEAVFIILIVWYAWNWPKLE